MPPSPILPLKVTVVVLVVPPTAMALLFVRVTGPLMVYGAPAVATLIQKDRVATLEQAYGLAPLTSAAPITGIFK